MHPDIEAIRPKLKEILYDCAVEIRATKAALYLFDGMNRFDLTSDYGFKVPIREWADRNDPIVDRCGRGRNSFFVNGLAEEPRFSEILYESQTDRLLVVPIYLRGQLVGLIDMRDKAGKQPFDQADIPKGQKIAERIAELFSNKNVFGQRFISLTSEEAGPAAPGKPEPPPEARPRVADMPANIPHVVPRGRTEEIRVAPVPVAPPRQQEPPPPAPAAHTPLPGPVAPQAVAHVPRVATIVLESRTLASNIIVARSDDVLGDPELVTIRESLKSTLSIPAAVAAMFSAFEPAGGIQEIVSRATLTEEALSLLQARLNIWLSKRGEAGGVVRTTPHVPPGSSGPPLDAAQLARVFTAPVTAGTLRNLYLTVAFSGVPDRNAHELLAENLNQAQISIEQSLNRAALQRTRLRAAEKLLEPDFSTYPELRRHTDAVIALVDRFCRELSLPPSEAEQAHLAAIVHDCGMRLLEYERLYRKRDVTPDEISILREHVFVGAAIVEPILAGEIARIVLCHHERVDGHGYPHELHGEQIPFAARLLQICDAYAAMTDTKTYQPPETPESALAIIARGAGTQFDSDLAARFVGMMRSGR